MLEVCRYVVLNPVRAKMAVRRKHGNKMDQLPGYCGKGSRASLLDNGVGAVPVQWVTCQSGGGDNYLRASGGDGVASVA